MHLNFHFLFYLILFLFLAQLATAAAACILGQRLHLTAGSNSEWVNGLVRVAKGARGQGGKGARGQANAHKIVK